MVAPSRAGLHQRLVEAGCFSEADALRHAACSLQAGGARLGMMPAVPVLALHALALEERFRRARPDAPLAVGVGATAVPNVSI